jgi:hypothetical protein
MSCPIEHVVWPGVHVGGLQTPSLALQCAGVAHVDTTVHPVCALLQTWSSAPLHWYSPGLQGAEAQTG